LTLPIVLRDAVESDLGFILSSWLRATGDAWGDLKESTVDEWAVAHGGLRVGAIADIPRRFTRHAVAEILQRPEVRVAVACDPEDAELIYGYAVCEPANDIIHWAHVKHSFRRNGIGRAMVLKLMPDFETKGATATYLGRWFLEWSNKWPLRFDPYAGR
jgi:ribosomal protein S18 acetylase RimI-like enzyme